MEQLISKLVMMELMLVKNPQLVHQMWKSMMEILQLKWDKETLMQ